MARRKAKKAAPTPGERVGTKRRDMRWKAPDGTVWDSRFEFEVYRGFKTRGLLVRKLESPKDSLGYSVPVRGAECTKCGSNTVVQRRVITPDLFVDQTPGRGPKRDGYRIEARGYLQPSRRHLFRCFKQTRPSLDIRFVFQRNGKAGKRTYIEWARDFMKAPAFVWEGPESIPDDWLI